MSDTNTAGRERLPDYAEIKGLTELFGDSPRVRILAVFLGKHYTDLPVSDIAHLAGVHRTTVYDHLNALEHVGVIRRTRTVGRTDMWQLNKDNRIAKSLGQLDNETLIAAFGAGENDDNEDTDSDNTKEEIQ